MKILPASLKARLRKTTAYHPLLFYKAHQNLKRYLSWRDQAYNLAPEVFGSSGYLTKSYSLVAQRLKRQIIPKDDIKHVRLLVITHPNISAIWCEQELARSFDAHFLSVTRHLLAFRSGYTDLLTNSIGVSPEDRFSTAGEEINLPIEWKRKLQQDILELAADLHRKSPIDLCFVNGRRDAFTGETFRRLEEIGIPVAFLWLDEKHAFQGDSDLAASCTIWLTNSREALRWYLVRNIPVYYFPQAIDPEVYRPLGLKKDIPVSFMGAAYGYRFEFIRRLEKAGIPIQCFGRGWGNPVRDQIEIYNRTLINIGIGTTGLSKEVTCLKGRDFEVPATGSLYLTTYDPEFAEMFHIGREALCYRNEFDCIEQIYYYLEQPDEAEAIGLRGRERCLREHTWKHRIIGLLRWMGILNIE
jgi:hypothetical protein